MTENEHATGDRDNRGERPKPELSPRVWIGSLADYNAGRLHGEWVDAAVDGDDLVVAATSILRRSREPGAEEWAVFDSDEFGEYRVGEYDDLRHLARVARGISEHGSAFAAWAELVRHDDPDRLDDFAEAFVGTYDSKTAWAEECISDLAGDVEASIGEWLRPYVRIDYDGFARDSSMAGEVEFVDHALGVWVFDVR